MNIDIPSSGGIHTATMFDSNGNLTLAPKSIFTQDITDTSYWQPQVGKWTYSGDTATISTATGEENYLLAIIHLAQTFPKKITVRVKASGQDIVAGGTYGVDIFDDHNLFDQTVYFPSGTWSEDQAVNEIMPTGPINYLYVKIKAYDTSGQLTVWQPEVLQDGDPVASYGEFISDTLDLYRFQNALIATGSLVLKQWELFYGDVSDVDYLQSLQHSIDALSQFDYVVIAAPGESNNTPRMTSVQQALVAAGIMVFGYVQTDMKDSNGNPDITTMEALIKSCADAGFHGIFFDRFGYDYGNTRATQNTLVSYAHSLGLMACANAWWPNDAMASIVDPTYNPAGTPPELGKGTEDWYLFESFMTTSANQYAGSTDFASVFAKYQSGVELAKQVNVKTVALAYALSSIRVGDYSDAMKAYILAAGLGMDGFRYGGTSSDQYLEWGPMISVPIGNVLTSPMSAVTPTEYQAQTDQGVLCFDATETPLARRAWTFLTNTKLPSVTVRFAPPIVATKSETYLETQSPGDSTWATLSPTNIRRLIRWRAVLKN